MKTVSVGLCMAAMVAAAPAAQAAPLSIVAVAAPPINCIFNTTCTITVTDSIDTITVPAGLWSGTARLQSRTFTGAPGAPAAGKTGYEYRIDLTQAVSDGEVPCVTDLSVDFGPVTKLQYNNNGPLDDVYVVTKGGLGSVGLFAADQIGDIITFTFNQPVCAGLTPGSGHTTFFFGLTSAHPPKSVAATVGVPGLLPVDVKARAPSAKP